MPTDDSKKRREFAAHYKAQQAADRAAAAESAAQAEKFEAQHAKRMAELKPFRVGGPLYGEIPTDDYEIESAMDTAHMEWLRNAYRERRAAGVPREELQREGDSAACNAAREEARDRILKARREAAGMD